MTDIEPAQRIICALDTDDIDEATSLADRLTGRVGAVKLGLEFFTAERESLPLAFELVPRVAQLQGVVDLAQLALVALELGLGATRERGLEVIEVLLELVEQP